MASLIAILSSGKGTWAQVNSIISKSKWDSVYLLCNDYAYENYEAKPGAIKLKFNEKNPMESLPKLAKAFKNSIKDFEVCVNMASGTGVEHMVLVSAVLKAGLGLRFVYFDGAEVKEFEILDESYSEDYDDSF